MFLRTGLRFIFQSRKAIVCILLLLLLCPALAQQRKLSQIPHAGSPPALTDSVVGVTGGATDNLYSLSQIQSVIGAGAVNVVSYGAKCDGITDDTAAIASAIIAAGSTANNQTSQSILFIPGQCLITSTLTMRSGNSNYDTNFLLQCSGGGAGLLWGGADNTGPMLQLGDVTGVHLDGAFMVSNCWFGGKDSSHNPNIAINLSNSNNSRFVDVTVGLPASPGAYVGIQCAENQCLITTIDHSNFACANDCIKMTASANNGTQILNSQFSECGRYCYEGTNDASVVFFQNYFEGNHLGTELGSIFVSGFGDRFISNTFEDGIASISGFRSIVLGTAQDSKFYGNYYIGAPSGTYRIDIGSTGSSDAEFFGEQNIIAGSSGFFAQIINGGGGGHVIWHGGTRCVVSELFGGANANFAVLEDACGVTTSAANSVLMMTMSGSGAGTVQASMFSDTSISVPTPTGGTCTSIGSQVGNAIGKFNATGVCAGGTLTLTFAAIAAAHGWSCDAADTTNPANVITQSGYTTGSVTFTGTWSNADVITYKCLGF